jgi:hypothetical protein
MTVDKSKHALLFPGDASHKSRLAAAGALHFKKIDGKSATWRSAARAVRPGDTVFIWVLVNVPTKRGQDELQPSAQPREFIREVEARGGVVVEVYTGRTTSKKSDREAMIRDAVTSLKSKGRSKLPPGFKKRGRRAVAWTDEQLDEAKRAWFSRDYETNEIAERHMPTTEVEGEQVPFGSTRARRMWGPNGRPWPSRRSRR